MFPFECKAHRWPRSSCCDVTTSEVEECFGPVSFAMVPKPPEEGRTDGRRWQIRLDLYQLAGSPGPDAEFNRAMLDHGALVCRGEQPLCDECPLQERCVARGGFGLVSELTVPADCADAA
jgi:hypothetical protein